MENREQKLKKIRKSKQEEYGTDFGVAMNDKNWSNQIISYKELLLLSNHGEVIEHPPKTASRLIAVLATSLFRNSFMEDLL